MKKYILILYLVPFSIFSQVGIGTTNPNADAMLDVESVDQGVLIPRLSLDQTANATPLSAHVAGMLVYNTTTVNDVVPGFYYNDGSKWVLIASDGKDWTLLGNTGTDNTVNFLGTTDVQPLTLRVNNIEKARLETNGTISTLNTGNSVFIGEGAGIVDDLNDRKNVFIGYNAGNKNTDGLRNTAVGHTALTNNETGRNNTAIGGQALNSNTDGDSNVAIGAFTLTKNTIGRNNVAMGNQALRFNLFGENNTAIGDYAGRAIDVDNVTDNDNDHNVFIGGQSGGSDLNGRQNVYIGYLSGGGDYVAASGSNPATGTLEDKSGNVFIGYNSGYNESGSNKLYIENSDSATPLIYGEFDNDILRTNGTLQINDPSVTGYQFPTADGTANQILVTDGNGQLSFQDNSGTSTFSLVRGAMGGGSQTVNTTTGNYDTIEFDGETFDTNNEFNTGTYTFSPAVDGGYYEVSVTISTTNINNMTDEIELAILVNGSVNSRVDNINASSIGIGLVLQVDDIIQLDSSDNLTIGLDSHGQSVDVSGGGARTYVTIKRVQ